MDLHIALADKIDPVAVYAALVATGALIWQITIWLKTGPKLVGRATAGMKIFGGSREDLNTYVVIRVENRGTQTTTITTVGMSAYESWWQWVRKRPGKTFVINHVQPGYPLPFAIEPGKTFMSMAVQDADVVSLSRTTRLYADIWHSFSHKPVRARIEPIVERVKKSEAKEAQADD